MNETASSEHTDLLVHIFTHLISAPIKIFAEWAQQLHINYLEAKLPDLTPSTLLKHADDNLQVLKNAGQWKDAETPAVMALHAAFEKQHF
jgi:hypothetical protein